LLAMRPALRSGFDELAAQEGDLARYHQDELEKLSAEPHFASITPRLPTGLYGAGNLRWLFDRDECDVMFRHGLHNLVEWQIKLKVSAGALHERTLSDRERQRLRLQSQAQRMTLRQKFYADRSGRIKRE